MSDQASSHGGASQCFLLVHGSISHSQLPSLANAATSQLQALYALLQVGLHTHMHPHHQRFYGDNNDHAPGLEP